MDPAKTAHGKIALSCDEHRPVIVPLVIAMGIFNILVPLLLVLFTWEHATGFVQTLRISNLIILTMAMLDFQFYVRRATAPFVRTSAYAWLITLCGTVAPLLFRPTDDVSDFWGATLLQVTGLIMQMHVFRMLNGRPGTVVGGGDITTVGLFRYVRHPIYLAFMLSQYGYVLNHTSIYNLFVLAFATCFQILRVNEEERLLRDDEAYQEYAKLARWRVIPGVF